MKRKEHNERVSRVLGRWAGALILLLWMAAPGMAQYYGSWGKIPWGAKEPLRVAIVDGDLAKVRALLDAGAKVDGRASDAHYTPLMAACVEGEPGIVQLLLERGAQVEARVQRIPIRPEKEYGVTALQLLVSTRPAFAPRIAKMLLDKGADVNARNKYGGGIYSTPFTRAFYHKDIALARLVLPKADLKVQVNPEGDTVLLATANELARLDKEIKQNGTTNQNRVEEEETTKALLRLLLTRCDAADVQHSNQDGLTALHYLAQVTAPSEFVRVLVAKGADVNALTRGDLTPLMLATKNGNASAVKALLEAKANPEAGRGEWNRSALIIAAETGHEDVVKLLLGAGANVHRETEDRRTALLLAAEGGHENIVKLLNAADAGADAGAKGNANKQVTALLDLKKQDDLVSAVGQNNPDEVKRLLAAGANPNAPNRSGQTPLAANNGGVEMARLLLEKGADVNASNPLMAAVGKGDLALVKLLLERGAKINPEGMNDGAALIRAMTIYQGEAIAKLLLDQGAKVNAKDEQDLTALHYAATAKLLPMARLLLERGADINVADKQGETPLMKATIMGASEMVELLLTKHPNLRVKNEQGKTALDLAEDRNQAFVANLLRQAGATE